MPRVALWLFGIAVFINVVIAVLFVPGDIDSVCTPDTMNGYWSIAGRCISINDTLYLSTVTRAGGLLLGAALAMVWRPVAVMRGPMRDKGRQLDLLAFGGFVILAMLMWWVHLADPAENSLTGSQFDPWLFRGGLFLAGLATVMIITAVTHRGAITGRLLGNPVLSWVGTRSYGLYLFHWPIYQIIREQAGVKMSLGQFVLAMIITVPITELSYRLVEMPVRKGAIGRWMRREHRPRSAAQAEGRRRLVVVGAVMAVLVGAAGVSVALAPNQCVGEVECASEAGREAPGAAPRLCGVRLDAPNQRPIAWPCTDGAVALPHAGAGARDGTVGGGDARIEKRLSLLRARIEKRLSLLRARVVVRGALEAEAERLFPGIILLDPLTAALGADDAPRAAGRVCAAGSHRRADVAAAGRAGAAAATAH
jgi:hypothetical protein